MRLPGQPALLYLHVWQPDYMSEVFWVSAEMELETILQYYGVPTVSARNSLYQLYMANVSGFESLDWLCGWHPNPLGSQASNPPLGGAPTDELLASMHLGSIPAQFPASCNSSTGWRTAAQVLCGSCHWDPAGPCACIAGASPAARGHLR